jgi:outer membrane protein assembly factor BamB
VGRGTGERGSRASARRSGGVRLLPATALATLLAVVVAARLGHSPSPFEGPRGAPVALTASSGSPSPTSALERPLVARGAEDDGGAFARVTSGGARTLHGDARRTHRASARGPDTARVSARIEVGGPVTAQVTASPDEKTLYAATLAGALVAIDRERATIRWRVELGDRVYGAPLVLDDGTVMVGSDAKKLVAISPRGSVVFRLELDGEVDGAPALGRDGTVIVNAGRTVVSVRRGGDVAWRFSAHGKVYASPAVTDQGLVVFGSQDDHVYALAADGTLAWAVDLGSDVDGAPAIADDGTIAVGTDKGEVVQLDPRGTIKARTPVGGFVRGALAVARDGDVLAGTYGPVPRVVRVARDGSVRGAFAIQGTGAREFGIHGAPLEDAAGTLFFGAQDDVVRAVGMDGALRWSFRTKADVDAPLTLLSDGTLVLPSEDGTVTLLGP